MLGVGGFSREWDSGRVGQIIQRSLVSENMFSCLRFWGSFDSSYVSVAGLSFLGCISFSLWHYLSAISKIPF